MVTTTPSFQDEVQHIGGTMGTVIATYKIDDIDYLDVRIGEHILWKTLAKKWEVIRTLEEIEGISDD